MEEYHNKEQYKLEQNVTSGKHLENFLIIILTLPFNLHICRFKSGAQLFSLIIIPMYFD